MPIDRTARRTARLAFVGAALLCACAQKDYVRLYQAAPKAPSLAEEDIAALKILGPTLVDKGVNFGVYSEHATRIELLLFDDPEASRPTRQFLLTRFGDVWNVYIEGVGLGQHYGYIAWGPNWPFDEAWYPGAIHGFKADVDSLGNRFNPNKLLLDPYAKALHRDHDWSKGSVASGPRRAESSYAASSKSVVVRSEYKWSEAEAAWLENRTNPEFPDHRFQDLVLYEVHPKGFTASPASGVAHPGTFRGFGEKADYFKELGVNAVELLPVHEKPLDGGYWGYQTLNFFAPELSYSLRKEPGAPIDEFKWMVEELHKRGIEVILDVVYNHTGEGGLWREKLELDGASFEAGLANFDPKEVAGLYSFRGLDNAAYYALNKDNQTYWNNTGVGNQTRPNHKPMRRLILDSLHYWIEEMHVDGFRFDLAPILGEKDLDFNNWDDPKNTVLQDIIDDPLVLARNVRIIAEPWSAGGNYGARVGAFPSSTKRPGFGWGEWNGRFRDWWRAFVNDDNWKLNSREAEGDGGFLISGSFGWYNPTGRRPYHSNNFVTVHDGFTLYDVFSYDKKQNKCGPLNPICCDQPYSAFCDRDSGESNNRSRNWGQEKEGFKRQQMRNLFMAMMISHGTPLLLGGDEWMRTQLGNNNAYSTRADNEFNWFDWGIWQASPERLRMHDFVSKALRFRRERRVALAPAEYGKGAPFSWKNEKSSEPPNWGGKTLMIHYPDRTKGPELVILVNMEVGPVRFTLPGGREWVRLVDTQEYFESPEWLVKSGTPEGKSANITLDRPEAVPGGSYEAKSRSIVVLEAR
jgi:glycogen operon protein